MIHSASSARVRPRLCVVVPVFNDWVSFAELSRRLCAIVAPLDYDLTLVAVDDGSVDPPPAERDLILPNDLRLVRLIRNVGHQKAIAIGLDHATATLDADVVAVMDADGEDRPEDLPTLLAAHAEAAQRQPGAVAVARRARRTESARFVVSYRAYKLLFQLLTGERVDFGNFCVMGRTAARRLTAMHELWLNLPATVVRSRLPLVRVAIDRGTRYAGQSKMSLVSLTTHGFSAVGVFSERAFTRVLLSAGGIFLAMGGVLALALVLKAMGEAAPGWVTSITGTLIVVMIQTATVALGGLFIVFGNKSDIVLAPRATAAALIDHIEIRPASSDE